MVTKSVTEVVTEVVTKLVTEKTPTPVGYEWLQTDDRVSHHTWEITNRAHAINLRAVSSTC
jgi:aspartokinase-like uncharacterized kinase